MDIIILMAISPLAEITDPRKPYLNLIYDKLIFKKGELIRGGPHSQTQPQQT